MRTFSKKTLVALYGCCRQAERSLHHALSGPGQWPDFIAYYDTTKQQRLAECLKQLASTGASDLVVVSREALRATQPNPLVSPLKQNELVERRLDLHICQWLIEQKLIGIAEIRAAAKIEHYNQSSYCSWTTFRDLGVA